MQMVGNVGYQISKTVQLLRYDWVIFLVKLKLKWLSG